VTARDDHLTVAVRVAAAFDAIGVRHTIGGSIAASIAGEPRSTLDIDFVAALTHDKVTPLVAALGDEFYADAASLHRAVDLLAAANLIHQASQIKVDVFVAGGTPLDELQLSRRQRIEVRPGQVIYVHPPEDVVLQKLRWYRKGGRTSDRQWRDILAVIRTQGSRLDRDYLRTNAPTLDVLGDLERALAEGLPP
jgi:hypothetical protein